MRNCFPRTVFVNTSISSERIGICTSGGGVKELDPDSTDTFKQNMVE